MKISPGSKGNVPRLRQAWHALCGDGDKVRMPARRPRVVRRGTAGGHWGLAVRSLPRGLEAREMHEAREGMLPQMSNLHRKYGLYLPDGSE